MEVVHFVHVHGRELTSSWSEEVEWWATEDILILKDDLGHFSILI